MPTKQFETLIKAEPKAAFRYAAIQKALDRG